MGMQKVECVVPHSGGPGKERVPVFVDRNMSISNLLYAISSMPKTKDGVCLRASILSYVPNYTCIFGQIKNEVSMQTLKCTFITDKYCLF